MSDYVEPRTSLFTSLRIQIRVIGALTLREMGSRFGRDNLGYLWLFLEPAMLGGAIGAFHELSGQGLPGGLQPGIFWVMGYIPFYLFRGVVNRAPVAILGSQSLLYHMRITVLDIILAKNILELAAVTTATLLFLALFAMAVDFRPVHIEYILFGIFLMWALSNGLCLLIAAGSVYSEIFERITHLFTYLSLPVLGAFFMVFWLPTEAQSVALWIPTVHCFEMIRFGLYGTQVPTTFDLTYLGAWILGLNLLGLAALRHARRSLVI